MAKERKIQVTQVRGSVGCTKRQRLILRALGLRRRGQTTRKPDNPAVRGMIEKVSHLVEVEES